MLRSAVSETMADYKAANKRFNATGTDEARLERDNKLQRARVASKLANSGTFGSSIAKHALSSVVRKQLNAATTDSVYKLDGLSRIVDFIEIDSDESLTQEEIRHYRMKALRDAWLRTIAAISATDGKWIDVQSVRSKIPNSKGTGNMSASPVRNCIGALYTLGLLQVDCPNAPRYIKQVGTYRFKAADSEVYGELLAAAKLALSDKLAAMQNDYE